MLVLAVLPKSNTSSSWFDDPHCLPTLLLRPVGNRRRHLTSTPFFVFGIHIPCHERQTDHDGSETISRYASFASIKVLNSDAGPKHLQPPPPFL